MNTDCTLRCRITATTKARIDAVARQRAETASTWLRNAIEHALAASGDAAQFGGAEAPPGRVRGDRVSIRLRPGDGSRLRYRAAARGLKPSTYVAALVRRHVSDEAPLPQPELVALKQTLSQLVATSSLLRQGDPGSAELADRVAALAANIDALRVRVADLVRRNAESWSGDV